MRVILVPLSGEAHDRAALAAAYHVARPFRAHITGLFIRPDPVDVIGVFQGIPPEMVDRVTRAATVTWNEHGRLADLVVFAGVRGDRAAQVKEHFATALFNTARPILLIPEQGIEHSARNVVIAWNGTAEATRALSGALPLLLNADRLHVLTAATPRTRVESGAALAEYLGWHGLICEVHPMYPENEVGPALLARAKELEADLLVMGGYGRSRMRERIFGGVTQHVLDHHEMPILIAH